MRTELTDITEELLAWWESETPEFRLLVLRILAALPGSDALDGLVDPLALGWKEVSLLAGLLSNLDSAADVEYVIHKLLEEANND